MRIKKIIKNQVVIEKEPKLSFANEEILKAKVDYQEMFDINQVIMIVVEEKSGNIIKANNAACKFYGYTLEKLETMNILEVNTVSKPEIIQKMDPKTDRVHNLEVSIKGRDGLVHTCIYNAESITIGGNSCILISLTDITHRKEIEEELIKSEQKYKLLFTAMNDAFSHHRIICDELGKPIDFTIVTANPSFETMTGLKLEEIIGKTASEVMPGFDQLEIEIYGRVALTGESVHFNTFSKKLNKYFEVKAYSPSANEFATIFIDISERVEIEKNIEYLNYHDVLTGLYNRRFFDEETRRMDVERNLPLSMIYGDVNGLKLINDAFGHLKGDELLQKAALAIRSVCRTDDIIARWGGDEYVIILPKTKAEEANVIAKRIKETFSKEYVNSISCSIALGWDTKCYMHEDILKTLKNAEDLMYKNKTLESERIRINTIKTLMGTLHEKFPRLEQEAKRVSQLCQDLGRTVGMPEWEICKVGSAGFFCHIGYVSINEDILNKPGELLEQEWAEIKKHSEVGFRILSSSHEMSELAGYVLAHHERWDGKGYPKGLHEKDIPIEARIIAIASSYVAMTSERPYRSAFQEEEAKREILKQAGTQFDPEITKVVSEKLFASAFRV